VASTRSRASGRLPILAAYALPVAPATFLFVLTIVYFIKFGTDVLLVSPGAIATIFGLSRIWDAISDPVAGFFSDGTRLAFGRRRSWILGSALPMALTALMVWSPPQGLEGTGLVVWLAIGIFGFSTAYTAFEVPHNAFGAELSDTAEMRGLLFGARTWLFTLGSYSALTLGIATIRTADEPRVAATWLVGVVGLVTAAVIATGVLRLKERADYAGRGGRSPFRAYRDVLRNRHARVVLLVVFIEYLGSGGALVMITYVFDYVLDAVNWTEVNFLAIGVAMFASVPVWVALTRRIDRKHVWRIAMLCSAFGCAMQFTAGLLGSALGFVIASLACGFGGSANNVLGAPTLADVVDYDELETGERKEGTYFASWHFMRKTMQGLMLMVAGLALEWSGFQPNVEQNDLVNMTILAVATAVPCVGYLVAFLIFSRYQLTAPVHAEIRAELDRRAAN
jgi:GPH family glycoside/pentoside/hexuronide:cation symporter